MVLYCPAKKITYTTCSKNDKMKVMLEWVITACVKTQLLKLSGQKAKNHEKSVRAAILGLGLPFMQVILLLWQLSESNMHITGHFWNSTEITSTWTQILSWKYSKTSFKFTILWRWKKSACYYNLHACVTELNPFHMNFQERCHTCVFCVGICSASAILL